MKDTEKMRMAVLAECERLCPKEGDQWIDEVIGLRIRCAMTNSNWKESKMIWIVNAHGASVSVSPREKDSTAFVYLYRILGLSERDAVAELREESDKYFTELKAERAKVAALHARKFMRVLDSRTVKGAPDKVPMEILSNSHAEKQHGGQSLDKLNSRGGLSCLEIVANLHRVSPSSILSQVNDEMAVNEIEEAIKVHDQESNKVAYLEKRNDALVAAINEAIHHGGYFYANGHGEHHGNGGKKVLNVVGKILTAAIEANEKGGVQG